MADVESEMADVDSEEPSARDHLLTAAVNYVSQHGISDLSLRGLAVALGTSHRMLIYHFGSKQGPLVEVVRVVEEQRRRAKRRPDTHTIQADPTAAATTMAAVPRTSQRRRGVGKNRVTRGQKVDLAVRAVGCW